MLVLVSGSEDDDVLVLDSGSEDDDVLVLVSGSSRRGASSKGSTWLDPSPKLQTCAYACAVHVRYT